MSNDTSDLKDLEEKLSFASESGWLQDLDRDEVEMLAEEYKSFLTCSKTEREAVDFIVEQAEEEGFTALDELDDFAPGAKIYAVNRGKQVVLARLGEDLDGVKMTIAHLDSPRLDLKQRPLYEDADLGLMDTHYYGGIKKYQWVNVPLALHGTVVDEDGESHSVVIGEDDEDPVFVVPDLLPHLGKEQLKKKLKEAIEGEDLNVVVGNLPVDDEDVENAVKLTVLQHLEEEYGFTEEDLISAEFEAVPALEPRDMGFDRSMIAAYGQDDKGLSFTTLQGLFDADSEQTAVACFFDKEEIGSEGNTSAQSAFLERFFARLLDLQSDETSHSGLYDVFDAMEVLSTDVSAAVNPTFKEVHDDKNALNLGEGVALVKFTGHGGKYSANDSHAEFVGKVRQVLNEEDIPWAPAELGKVDTGGGGTVAKFVARRGADVVDLGFGLLSMHSPYEVSSKADVFHTYRACRAFFESD
jgi:aspartyl aminopeptidase